MIAEIVGSRTKTPPFPPLGKVEPKASNRKGGAKSDSFFGYTFFKGVFGKSCAKSEDVFWLHFKKGGLTCDQEISD
ncbi:MAG: hypothetical protein JHC45_04160 [Candidatus Fonsibacter sp.]|nr:hypothetical protein [Candidatus Fonsibacter sp.]